MDELQRRLTERLADRYGILSAIGHGGMASVYLAHDFRHSRQVAIKVFRPELAASLGHQRFLREIAVAGRLNHPNIVALYDSGDAGGDLYFVMPYINGESVGARLARVRQLPIDDAVTIARQMAAALDYAHRAGIVHRDIKPDNILLTDDGAMLTDFGISQAVESTGDQKLTATGFAVGTPEFMSPEQCAATGPIDARSDIYSLGCVLYTMLVGEPPFSGITAQATLARHLAEPVPSLRVVRPSIPPAVEYAVQRAMAKSPADRFATAAEFAAALAPERLTDPLLPAASARSRRRPGWVIPALVVLAVAIVAMATRPLWRTPPPPPTLDPSVVMVLPFRPGPSLDSAATGLVATMAGMVIERLPGNGGPRAIAAPSRIGGGGGGGEGGANLAQVRQAARAAGAGAILVGTVATAGDGLSFSAVMHSTANDSVLAEVDNVIAGRDRIAQGIDSLVAVLLVRAADVPDSESVAILRLPLPTVRRYLAGRERLLRGQFDQAGEDFQRVLQVDSTCFPAALGLGIVATINPKRPTTERAVRLARQSGYVLSSADSSLLHAIAWTLDPSPTLADRVARFDVAAAEGSDDPVRWYLLGDRLFHDGPLLGLPDALRRAAASFDQAIKLDSNFVPALGGAIDLAADRRDTAAVRLLATRYFKLDTTSAIAQYYRWRAAVALGDSSELESVRESIADFERPALDRIVNVAQIEGVALSDAVLAANALWQQGGTGGSTRWGFIKQRELALNRGRPAEANAILVRWQSAMPFRPLDAMAEVVDAIWWGADTTFPAKWVDQFESTPAPRERDAGWYLGLCADGLWRMTHGRVARVAATLAQLRQMDRSMPQYQDMALCEATIAASLAHQTGAGDARAKLARLDSIARSVPSVTTWMLTAANLTAAKLWEAAGNPANALAAVRRRPYITDLGEPRVLVALSTMLREEGRLAAVTGDTTGAVEAYQRYLALRSDPEPGVKPTVDSVRAALGKLR